MSVELRLVYNQILPAEVYFEVSTNPVMQQAKQKLDALKKAQSEKEQEAHDPSMNQIAPNV